MGPGAPPCVGRCRKRFGPKDIGKAKDACSVCQNCAPTRQASVTSRQKAEHGNREDEQREQGQEPVEGDTPGEHLSSRRRVPALNVARPSEGTSEHATCGRRHARMLEGVIRTDEESRD